MKLFGSVDVKVQEPLAPTNKLFRIHQRGDWSGEYTYVSAVDEVEAITKFKKWLTEEKSKYANRQEMNSIELVSDRIL